METLSIIVTGVILIVYFTWNGFLAGSLVEFYSTTEDNKVTKAELIVFLFIGLPMSTAARVRNHLRERKAKRDAGK